MSDQHQTLVARQEIIEVHPAGRSSALATPTIIGIVIGSVLLVRIFILLIYLSHNNNISLLFSLCYY